MKIFSEKRATDYFMTASFCSFKKKKHSICSLRHNAICMRIILSEGKVNIFNLAKNPETWVGQIERFYARHLPLSAEMARNLHSFGG